MSWGMVAVAGAAIVGGIMQSNSARDASDAQVKSAREGISEQRAARESFERRTDPFRLTGQAAAMPILELLGIQAPRELSNTLTPTPEYVSSLESQLSGIDQQIGSIQSTAPVLTPNPKNDRGIAESNSKRLQEWRAQNTGLNDLTSQRNQLSQQLEQARLQPAPETVGQPMTGQPTQGEQSSLLAQVNPLVSFLRDEGFQDIQESAAASGRLRSGGTLQDLTRFNTNLAATVVPQLQQQRFNQLFNLLGLGQNAAVGQGSAALSTATNIGNLLGQQGQAQAANALQQGQIGTNTSSGLAGVYGAQQAGLFNRPKTVSGGVYDTGSQTDFATGAVSSPLATNRSGGFQWIP